MTLQEKENAQPPQTASHHSADPQRNRLAAEECEQILAATAGELAVTGDLGKLCALVAERARVLAGADEAVVYLETRPLSPGEGPLHLTLPLRLHKRNLAVLSVKRCPGAAPFNAEDESRLRLLANIATIALAAIKREHSARQRGTWRASAHELLHEMVRAMSSTLELVPLMRRVLKAMLRSLDAEVGVLALLDDNGNLVLRTVEGSVPGDIAGTTVKMEQGLMGWTIRYRRTALVIDPSADPRVPPEHILVQSGVKLRTLLAAPLITKGQTIGAVEIANRRSGAFDQGDLHLLEIAAFAAAVAIENTRLYERLTRQTVQQENVIRVSHAISSANDVETVLQEVVNAALNSIPSAFTAAVHLVGEETGMLQLRFYGGRPLWDTMEEPFSIGQGIAGRAFGTRQVVNVADVLDAPHFLPGPGPVVYRSLLVAPLIVENQPLGTLSVNGLEPEAFNRDDEGMIYALAAQTAVALRNASLYARAEERAQELELAYRQLQNLARRKNQFVQNTSHELRTPLTLMRGYLELLMEGVFGPLPEKQQEVVEVLNRKSEQLVDLVDDISSLIELELDPEDVETLDLREVLSTSVTAHMDQCQRAGIEVKTEWPATPVIIKGNARRLGQVVHHLLDNAVKFSPDGGDVRMRLWYDHEHAFVQVADQGIGIPPPEQELIFDRFYQVDGSTTRHFGGTGLGLAIVKETVEAHGGRVQMESSGIAGEGTSFTLILPRLEEPPPDA